MRTDRPNVLLVVMDSVRTANASCYGHENETTPFLETFADRATVYEQARAPGSWSLPSHASLFTGFHVDEHRLTGPGDRLEPGHTIFEDLRSAGYDTAVFSENPWLTAIDTGLAAGFDVVDGGHNRPFPGAADPVAFTAAEGQGNYLAFLRHCLAHERPVRSLLNGLANKLAWDYPALLPGSLSASSPAGTYAKRFLEWADDRERPWAACINFMDAHAPYEPADEYDRWGGTALRTIQRDLEKQVWSFHGGLAPWWQCRALSALYDGAIRQVDAAVAEVLTALDDRGVLDDTLVVVTSDHGEGFGEPSRLKPEMRVAGHVDGIHEALLHVPLLVREPGQRDARRVARPASLTGFPAAVRAVRDGRSPDGAFTDGPVLASSHGLTGPNLRLAEEYCDEDELALFRGAMRAVYEVNDGVVEKFATWRDRSSHRHCVDARTSYEVAETDHGRVAEQFSGIDDAGVRTASDPGAVTDATRKRLEDLGYA